MNGFQFEWDADKADVNRRKHGVTFDEASSVFNDPSLFVRYDEAHSGSEDRWKAIGLSQKGRLVSVIYSRRDPKLRIISARKADARESKAYAQSQG